MQKLLSNMPKILFFTGKGGAGKTSLSSAVAVGESLQRGAAAAMHKHVRESLGDAIPASSCCHPEAPARSCRAKK